MMFGDTGGIVIGTVSDFQAPLGTISPGLKSITPSDRHMLIRTHGTRNQQQQAMAPPPLNISPPSHLSAPYMGIRLRACALASLFLLFFSCSTIAHPLTRISSNAAPVMLSLTTAIVPPFLTLNRNELILASHPLRSSSSTRSAPWFPRHSHRNRSPNTGD